MEKAQFKRRDVVSIDAPRETRWHGHSGHIRSLRWNGRSWRYVVRVATYEQSGEGFSDADFAERELRATGDVVAKGFGS